MPPRILGGFKGTGQLVARVLAICTKRYKPPLSEVSESEEITKERHCSVEIVLLKVSRRVT